MANLANTQWIADSLASHGIERDCQAVSLDEETASTLRIGSYLWIAGSLQRITPGDLDAWGFGQTEISQWDRDFLSCAVYPEQS